MKLKNFLFFIIAVFTSLAIIYSCEIYELPSYKMMDIGSYNRDMAITDMQKFVENISAYAKGLKTGFIVIPQNGSELIYNETDKSLGVRSSYINAIDGVGIEELFYDWQGKKITDDARLNRLIKIKTDYSLPIMVSDYVRNTVPQSSIDLNEVHGFLAFPRINGNYDYFYHYIINETTPPPKVNTNNITNLSDAKNYLYVINTDKFSSKSDMITKISKTNYDVLIIDLFYEKTPLSIADINSLRTKLNGGHRLVIAYINIGAAETFRYYWKGNPPYLVKPYGGGYTDEYYAGFWTNDWQEIIFNNGESLNDSSYIKQIIDAGFDGIYMDNVEAYLQIPKK